ncbi:MAG: tRNA preQ1(34) S-adenosylmethionine ribosyltransferase-isomerase QueA [Gemmatimonadetes bacterium]|nr:tRNA preQ1(34) S-adenosylmethionine ribosyltransferase-isomerase QueA [Gemmatimonadota bacterium]MBI3569461.1 tRNA preQ1(34) S-adenosylmethionine ribosyltransferase-isomerase QueA [Gemmatimonadota bacterium]
MAPLRTADFDFDLSPALIAQRPAERRDGSRLMVVERASGTIRHLRFREIADLIPSGDLLVLNTTRVFRARLLGTRDSGAPAEVFLLRPLGDDRWEAMVSPGGKLKPGRVVHVAPGFDVEIVEVTERRTRVVRLRVTPERTTAGGGSTAEDAEDAEDDRSQSSASSASSAVASWSLAHTLDAIERHGHIPLPPYIERGDTPADVERYQTVYADQRGSVAAPTAGLHFTPELLAALAAKGVARADVLLHVGAGTFRPVEVDDPADHVMHEEWYRVSEGTAAAVNAARDRGAHVWAVGTTTLRTLESSVGADGRIVAGEGETRIFIRPPHVVRGADRLVTNFHLPRSTLLMLVAAFAGTDLMREAYAVAVAERYRFYSYGDAMVII